MYIQNRNYKAAIQNVFTTSLQMCQMQSLFLHATGQREIPAADNSQRGERMTRGAAGDAEAGDPQKTEALHSLHIHSLPAYLSQQLPASPVFQCGF